MREGDLMDIYFSVRDFPAWLAYFSEYPKEDIEFLEKLDDEFFTYRPDREVSLWVAEINKQGGYEMVSLETEDEKMSAIASKIYDFYTEAGIMISGSWSYADVILTRRTIERLHKIKNRIRAKMVHKPDSGDSVSDWEIENARNRPMSFVVKENVKFERIPCPFHTGKDRNFWIKGNFGYCHVCGEWCDAIKWRMVIDGMDFKSAVRSLQ